MNRKINRRSFINRSGAGIAATAVGLRSTSAQSQDLDPVRIGLVGVGNRGTGLLRILLERVEGVQIPAICDVKVDHLERARQMVFESGQPLPVGYSNGDRDFERLVERSDLDAVITATPWEWHTPVMIAAMKAGKYGATEVPAAVTLEECWQLVETSEETGMPCMLLENVNYYRESLMVLNMIQQGIFGEMLHCEGGYNHDVRGGKIDRETGKIKWRGKHSVTRNENLYPTHPIGPISWWLNINRGDRFTRIVSMSSKSRGINRWVEERFGRDHPNATRSYELGDINTSMIQTQQGRTVTLYHDTQSYRPYDLILKAQGTNAIHYSDGERGGKNKKIFVHGRSPVERRRHRFEWGADYDAYLEEFKHPLWKFYEEKARGTGHGGGDFMVLDQFVKAVRKQTEVPIDVYDAATWSAISALSGQSIAHGNNAVEFPDFTRGAWLDLREVQFLF
jgi:predicted dehydrogenase